MCLFFCEKDQKRGVYLTLEEFFKENPEVAVAFSGGVDSACLLYAAKAAKARVKAYYVKSEFQPEFELQDARRMAQELEVELCILEVSVLSEDKVRKNPKDRCYDCKRLMFNAIAEAAKRDGFSVLLDGTNASDQAEDRPGMRALQEFSVLSPLRQCGLKKEEIRRLSKEWGLFTWDKPAYACLATRISTGEEITSEKLRATQEAESYLFSLGFRDFRVRRYGNGARLQIIKEQLPLLMTCRQEILERLKTWYETVLLDLEVRG